MMDDLTFPDHPVKPIVSAKGQVCVGAPLKQRLEEAARVQGADAHYLARQILREHLDAHEQPPPPGGEQTH
jgi:hypothetical protein